MKAEERRVSGTPAAPSKDREDAVDNGLRQPAYLLIADTIAQRIGAGEYRPGDQLPTEAELRAEFGVSPMTVRRAINILLDRHLVTTTQGKGTFVRSLQLGEAVFHLSPITDVLDDAAVEISLLEAGVRVADERVASVLQCTVGDPTIHMRRLVTRDGKPLMYQLEWLIYDEHRPLVETQLQITSLNGLLRSRPGSDMPMGEVAIEATCLTDEETEILQVPAHSPAFCLEHVFYDFALKPVSWGRLLCRADRFRLVTHLGAPLPDLRSGTSA